MRIIIEEHKYAAAETQWIIDLLVPVCSKNTNDNSLNIIQIQERDNPISLLMVFLHKNNIL